MGRSVGWLACSQVLDLEDFDNEYLKFVDEAHDGFVVALEGMDLYNI